MRGGVGVGSSLRLLVRGGLVGKLRKLQGEDARLRRAQLENVRDGLDLTVLHQHLTVSEVETVALGADHDVTGLCLGRVLQHLTVAGQRNASGLGGLEDLHRGVIGGIAADNVHHLQQARVIHRDRVGLAADHHRRVDLLRVSLLVGHVLLGGDDSVVVHLAVTVTVERAHVGTERRGAGNSLTGLCGRRGNDHLVSRACLLGVGTYHSCGGRVRRGHRLPDLAHITRGEPTGEVRRRVEQRLVGVRGGRHTASSQTHLVEPGHRILATHTHLAHLGHIEGHTARTHHSAGVACGAGPAAGEDVGDALSCGALLFLGLSGASPGASSGGRPDGTTGAAHRTAAADGGAATGNGSSGLRRFPRPRLGGKRRVSHPVYAGHRDVSSGGGQLRHRGDDLGLELVGDRVDVITEARGEDGHGVGVEVRGVHVRAVHRPGASDTRQVGHVLLHQDTALVNDGVEPTGDGVSSVPSLSHPITELGGRIGELGDDGGHTISRAGQDRGQITLGDARSGGVHAGRGLPVAGEHVTECRDLVTCTSHVRHGGRSDAGHQGGVCVDGRSREAVDGRVGLGDGLLGLFRTDAGNPLPVTRVTESVEVGRGAKNLLEPVAVVLVLQLALEVLQGLLRIGGHHHALEGRCLVRAVLTTRVGGTLLRRLGPFCLRVRRRRVHGLAGRVEGCFSTHYVQFSLVSLVLPRRMVVSSAPKRCMVGVVKSCGELEATARSPRAPARFNVGSTKPE